MAIYPSNLTGKSVGDQIAKRKRKDINPSKPSGVAFLDTGTIAIGDLTGYDVDEDHIRILQFPNNCHLLGPMSITMSDYDSGSGGSWTLKLVTEAGVETAISGSLTTVPRAAGVSELLPSVTAGISIGVDASNQWLVLECDAAPSAPSSGATIQAKVAVYLGGLITL